MNIYKLQPKSFIYIFAYIALLGGLIFSTSSQVSYALSKADCDSRANSTACKQEIDNKCGGTTGDERQKCIQDVLTSYSVTGIGRDQVVDCSTDKNNAFNPSGDCHTALPKVSATGEQVKNGLMIVFGVAGGIALLSLALAAFNFATAATDAEKVARSKQAIIFSLLGLVIALSAEVLVLTLLDRL